MADHTLRKQDAAQTARQSCPGLPMPEFHGFSRAAMRPMVWGDARTWRPACKIGIARFPGRAFAALAGAARHQGAAPKCSSVACTVNGSARYNNCFDNLLTRLYLGALGPFRNGRRLGHRRNSLDRLFER